MQLKAAAHVSIEPATPIKLPINILPELHAKLEAYSRMSATIYGTTEPVAELIPAMLNAFLASDRTFLREWTAK